MAVSPFWSLGCTLGNPVLPEAADGQGLRALEEGDSAWQRPLTVLFSPVFVYRESGWDRRAERQQSSGAPCRPPDSPQHPCQAGGR